MLDARDNFQSAGWYEALERTVALTVAAEHPERILDVGCGTGYYLRGALAAVGDSARALGMDLSPAAVSRAARSSDRIDGLVADVWSLLPIRDGAANVILNVFAPRNAAEFHRVLRQGGLLLVVVPQQEHLQELRKAGLALDIQPDKAQHLTGGLAAHFTLESRQGLSEQLNLPAPAVAALIGMGPSAHHSGAVGTAPATAGTPALRAVTAAFDLFSFRRRDNTP
ncbi:methyltransferase domain-containing protein [Cryobacterium roopkundense]|uniref:23S rRNA (Guanine745-N1)-methyltransferase n=1 Tax=Cryobacterium roopkundense TaxID=1001240 RepID=A0A7W8ZVV7_9MICO|nr:methyltransferase domain-containing protein [Cryobacterium roopkundense]MBB5641191.1 23S rRNA (guanine745-N1)-methyltransferase [Cryobacterium roopkundense]